jgi:hypothetical protein
MTLGPLAVGEDRTSPGGRRGYVERNRIKRLPVVRQSGWPRQPRHLFDALASVVRMVVTTSRT